MMKLQWVQGVMNHLRKLCTWTCFTWIQQVFGDTCHHRLIIGKHDKLLQTRLVHRHPAPYTYRPCSSCIWLIHFRRHTGPISILCGRSVGVLQESWNVTPMETVANNVKVRHFNHELFTIFAFINMIVAVVGGSYLSSQSRHLLFHSH